MAFLDAAEAVRCLVREHYYLPFAAMDALQHIRVPCDLDAIMEEAVRTLISKDSEAEALRLAIHAIAAAGALHDADLPFLQRVVGAAGEAVAALPESKVGRRGRLRLLARLALLNFAAIPLEYHSVLITGKERSSPAAVPTVTASMLLARSLAGERPWSPVPEDVAWLVVGFGLGLRRRIVGWLLERSPRTAGDIVAPVHIWAERELEKPEWSKAREYREFIRGPLLVHVLREAVLAPYYLQHYGFLELDPVMYTAMWEIGKRRYPL